MDMKEENRVSFHLVAGLLLTSLLAPLASAQPWAYCMDGGGTYTENSTYQTNLAQISATLPANASRALFATAAVGAVPAEIVYALALCRGDSNASTCESCVATAFPYARQHCGSDEEVAVFFDECSLRLSKENFLADSSKANLTVSQNQEKVSSPVEAFDAAVSSLLNATGNYAAMNSSRRFATGVKGFDSSYPTIYGLAQCTPDLLPADCRSCLHDIIVLTPQYLSGRQGGGIMGVRCNIRYELDKFFNGNPTLRLQSPFAPAPAPNNAIFTVTPGGRTRNGVKIALAVSLAVVALMIGITIFCLCFFRRPATENAPPCKWLHNLGLTNCKKMNEPTCLLNLLAWTTIFFIFTFKIYYLILLKRKFTSVFKGGCRTEMARCLKMSYTYLFSTFMTDSTKCEDSEGIDSLLIDLSTLRAATDNFAESNWIGEGGFGSVYKGVLPDGQQIAVKRFSQSSGQGIQELKNELVLVSKLQHKNLARLVGVCLQEHEKLVVYDYMPKRSIDTILFDPERSKELDWGRRFNIIKGIARGLNYLHEDSQFKIIHRDLKASNVLLDSNYTPKISDFGLARLFGGDQWPEATKSVVGTYGYMAPEYAMRGHYSIKSDVFSFGILILEILTGRRSSGSYNLDESVDLISLVWEHWTTGTIAEIMGSSLSGSAPGDQILKCIHIGLLCVQDNPVDRPTISTVSIMLSSDTIALEAPMKPVFFIPKSGTL